MACVGESLHQVTQAVLPNDALVQRQHRRHGRAPQTDHPSPGSRKTPPPRRFRPRHARRPAKAGACVRRPYRGRATGSSCDRAEDRSRCQPAPRQSRTMLPLAPAPSPPCDRDRCHARGRVRRELREVQAGLDEARDMRLVGRVAGLAAFDGQRGAERREGGRLCSRQTAEADDGAGKQQGKVQGRLVQPTDHAVVRIETGVVVNIDAGEEAARLHQAMNLAASRRVPANPCAQSLPWPDAVVVGLIVEPTQTFTRGGDVADKNRQRPRQQPLAVGTQHALQRDDAAVFVAVQEHGDEQRRRRRPGRWIRVGPANSRWSSRAGVSRKRSGRVSSTVSMKEYNS
jgi:hypothetical protein